jgi:hypothetical protein
MMRTDLLQRAIPWTRVILETGDMPFDLNLKASQRISGAAAGSFFLFLLMIPWLPYIAVAGAVISMAVVILLNLPFYRFLAGVGGRWFALRSMPLHLLYFLCGVTGYSIAVLLHVAHQSHSSRDRR